jgi:hypothetical protein
MIHDFQSNTVTTVEPLEKGLYRVALRTDDNLFSAEVTLVVKAPALDIREASLRVTRDFLDLAPDLAEAGERLVGVRVGPGMTKIVRVIIAEEAGAPRVAELVLEAMEMLINALTAPELRKAAQMAGQPASLETDGPKIYLNDVLLGEKQIRLMAGNPRLKDSCAAFKGI